MVCVSLQLTFLIKLVKRSLHVLWRTLPSRGAEAYFISFWWGFADSTAYFCGGSPSVNTSFHSVSHLSNWSALVNGWKVIPLDLEALLGSDELPHLNHFLINTNILEGSNLTVLHFFLFCYFEVVTCVVFLCVCRKYKPLHMQSVVFPSLYFLGRFSPFESPPPPLFEQDTGQGKAKIRFVQLC